MGRRTSIPAVPVRSQMFDDADKLTRVWIDFFQGLTGPKYFVDAHSVRLDKYTAGELPVGTRFFESDRSVYYIVADGADGHEWHVQGGEMRGLLADIPSDLIASDVGFLFVATDYDRRFRWSGAAWVRADGEVPTGAVAMFPAVPAFGWALCDGSSVTRTKADGTTESFATPNMVGAYAKGGAYTGAAVGAVAGTVTGSLSTDGAHSHTTSVSVTISGTTGFATVQAGSGASVAANSHTHPFGGSFASDSQGAHTHTLTSASATGGEPAKVLFYFCTRL